jgi:hypothetical protein
MKTNNNRNNKNSLTFGFGGTLYKNHLMSGFTGWTLAIRCMVASIMGDNIVASLANNFDFSCLGTPYSVGYRDVVNQSGVIILLVAVVFGYLSDYSTFDIIRLESTLININELLHRIHLIYPEYIDDSEIRSDLEAIRNLLRRIHNAIGSDYTELPNGISIRTNLLYIIYKINNKLRIYYLKM